MGRGSNPYSHIKRGKRPDLGGIYFRSEAEVITAKALTAMGWRWEYEPQEFRFPVERGTTHYRPDFKAYPGDGEEYRWVEVKGWFDARTKTRLRRFARYFPEECRKLVIVTDWKAAGAWVDENMSMDVARYVEVWSLRKLRSFVR